MTMENSSNVDQPSKWKLPILIAGFVIVVALVFYFVFEGTKNDITIMNAGEKIEAKTHAATVGEALNESGIEVGKHDQVSPAKNTPIKDNMKIDYVKAKQVNVTDNGQTEKVWSTKSTVGELLKDENMTPGPHDVLNVSLDDKVKNDMNIDIDRAIELTLKNGDKNETVWTTKNTVGDLLAEKNITVDGDDRVSPAKDTKLTSDMNIEVAYVDKKSEEKVEQIAFDTVYKDDANLEKGQEKVVTEGKNGEKKVKYDVTYENGKEVKRDRVSEENVSDKQDKVVARGTKEAVQTVAATSSSNASTQTVSHSDSSAAPSGGKTFTMESTAYSGGGTTATGINLSANPGIKVVAVDPSVIPLGSKVWVEGYGVAVAGDTGGAIKGNIIDVYFDDAGSCYSWGRKTVTVKVL
ncbi:G5 and 3D domain-containing protein [Listeria costaricensis]|uniref:G5 and 3D domain-containing protein n=1 Tax=Listeria costaricensis TaxID=2026604 RepID=UPI000C06DBE0|nr:G5 and 3D domain-containing protein [Listeria costaricensis]